MIASNTESIGVIDASDRSTVIVDGEGGTHVACTVAGTASFMVHGTLDDTANTGN
jgi:hypothetical protein